MTLPWRFRLFAAYVAGIVAALVLATLLVARGERSWLIDRDLETLERSARHALSDLAAGPYARSRDWPAAAAALGETFGYRVTLIDRAGRVLGDSDVPPDRLRFVGNHAGRPEVRLALAGRLGHHVRRSATVGREFLYMAVPSRGVPGIAVLRVAKPLSEIARLNASLVRVSVIASLLALAVIGALLFWVSGRQAERVVELTRVAERLGRGDLAARARELPPDEVGRLGRAMNGMSAELRSRLTALERERDGREHILAHMGDGVALFDRGGRFVQANRSFASILGAPSPPAAGLSLDEFARVPGLDELLQNARRGDRPAEMELRLWTPHGRVVRATASRLGSPSDGSVLLVLHDLTEIELLNRVRQDFVANVSHELKTPLTSVRGYAETLLEGGLEDPENRVAFVSVIRDQAARLEDLVEDLLSLAELESPGAALRLTRFDLREAVERQAAVFRGRAERAGLRLEVEPGSPVPVWADRARLDQVIANLLDNALKYTERGGVSVRVGADDARAWCEVEDTGPGIPEEDLARVFERFYRVDRARAREKGGTGLGLSIVKHVLSLHGGEVSATSALGKGSRFRFEIPRRLDLAGAQA